MNKPVSVLHYQKAPAAPLTGVGAVLPRSPIKIANAHLAMAEIEFQFPELKGMDPKAKIAFVEKRRAGMMSEVAGHDRRLKDINAEMAALKERSAQLGELA